MPQANQQYCKACGQPIRWIKTQSGKSTPIDPDGMTHWATCTDAERFKSDYAKVKKALFDIEQVMNRLLESD
jgi:hypothetical protein